MERIRRMVYQYERMPAKKEEEAFYDELTRIHQIAVQIRTVIEHLDIYEEDSAIGFQQLVEQIAKRCSLTRIARKKSMRILCGGKKSQLRFTQSLALHSCITGQKAW
ncbi:MAG: hypothetical protein ACLR2O_08810 [Coprococcus sp.]